MADFLNVLTQSTNETIKSGYYEAVKKIATSHTSLKKAILETENVPVITEIKAASPSKGTIKKC